MRDEVQIEFDHLTDPLADPLVLTDTGWLSYEITSDIMAGADSFVLDLDPSQELCSWFRRAGHTVRIYVGGHLQLKGIVDAASMDVSAGGIGLQVMGRDYGGLLIDDAAPMLTYANVSLRRIVEQLVAPHGNYITEIVTDNAANRYRVCGKKGRTGRASPVYAGISSERSFAWRTKPGEKIWDRIEWLAMQIGCKAWMTHDGKLVLARPQYEQDPAYGTLYVDTDAEMNVTGSNCTMQHTSDIGDRYGTYVVTGQGTPAANSIGIDLGNKYRAATDPHPAFWINNGGVLQERIHAIDVQTTSDIENKKQVARIARTRLEERAVQSGKITATVDGHRVDDQSPIWSCDTICDVHFEPREIAAPYYVWKRTLRYNGSSRQTEVELIPAGIWLAQNHDTVDDAAYTRSLITAFETYAL